MKRTFAPKTLSRYIIKKYLSFLIVILLLFTLIRNAGALLLFGIDNLNLSHVLDAGSLIGKDYENTDISALSDIGGWIEILDENNHVVYTKGEVLDLRSQYSQEELLEMNALGALLGKKSFTVAGMLNITYKGSQRDIPRYLATYTAFERDGEFMTGLVRFPSEKVSAEFTVLNPSGKVLSSALLTGAALFLSCAAVFLFFLLRYAYAIRTHVAAPNEKLVRGLREITSGNYETRICLNAEYEYLEIEDSFNLLAEELMNATQERERLNQERRQLLSNIAHDLKTPITTLQGYAKALNDHMVTSPEQQEEYLSAVYRKSVHMTDLVNKLLEYSRLENDTWHFDFRKTEFTEFIRTVIIDQYEEFEARRIDLETDIPDQDILLSVDQTEIRRVLLNLLRNCIVHNPPGISARAVVRTDGRFCVFELWDNGTPIPPELQESIFKPFVCGDASRQSGNGSGLGLSICRKVAERHGGTIVLKKGSDGYKGFILRLPLS